MLTNRQKSIIKKKKRRFCSRFTGNVADYRPACVIFAEHYESNINLTHKNYGKDKEMPVLRERVAGGRYEMSVLRQNSEMKRKKKLILKENKTVRREEPCGLFFVL